MRPRPAARALACLPLAVALLRGQPASPPALDWRHVGTTALDLDVGQPAGGTVERVWFANGSGRMVAQLGGGRVVATEDGRTWTAGEPPTADLPPSATPVRAPEAATRILVHPLRGSVLVALGPHLQRSDDDGRTWRNLSARRKRHALGGAVLDVAFSPTDEGDWLVATTAGLWRTTDGGLSWTSLNDTLPNLPVRRLLGEPHGTRGVRVAAAQPGGTLAAMEWLPGERTAWSRVAPEAAETLAREAAWRRSWAGAISGTITAVSLVGEQAYAGTADGRLYSSGDGARTWSVWQAAAGVAVTCIWADPSDSRVALVGVGFGGQEGTPRLWRTGSGGAAWEDVSRNLPSGGVRGVTADRASGAVYVATTHGVWHGTLDLGGQVTASATDWISLQAGLPDVPAWDVRLGAGGHQLYVALDGPGVFATLAPHRRRQPRVVSAADHTERAAAPGGLVTILGARSQAARAGNLAAPVLDATDEASQVQVPFAAKGSSVSLAWLGTDGWTTTALPLRSAAPAIMVDRDGQPLAMDAESGELLDATKPARSGARVQVLATGLGQVRPEWPAGVAAPLASPPVVVSAVRAALDGQPVRVTRATLAPGYVGLYLVELELPRLVDHGPVELYLAADGQESNRVRLVVEP